MTDSDLSRKRRELVRQGAIEERLEDLSGIQDGWLDGEGLALTKPALELAGNVLERLVSDLDVAMPRIYPTPEGGVQAEWILGDWGVDVTFAPEGKVFTAAATNASTREGTSTTYFEANEHLDVYVVALTDWLKELASSV